MNELAVEWVEKADSEMTDEGVLLRYWGDELVGITILDVSKRAEV